MKLITTSKSSITAEGAFHQDKMVVANEFETFGKYMKACYQQLELAYPKFFKMDGLCKLCFIGTEFLLKQHSLSTYAPEKIAIILQNQHSSLVSDTKHFNSIKDKENYFPSPSVFVYTLPNIMIGELCIRHGITGEGTCFLPSDDPEFIDKYIQALFEDEGYQACITGKVDYTEKDYHAELQLVERATE
ncbi:hypothetical protein R9C00_01725 [Flammeovirgaceae bacterium SG7u.111]|nr:hypothetical protein [Flammeovirgaceae bacterium SG7u.132]WPO36161.1 hypothetical protein R9C00_01725 [Flammeovirgaceae bacterium SG7u.111]